MGYRNIYYDSRDRSVTLLGWDKDGRRVSFNASVDPYLYLEGNGEYESIYGTKLVKKIFRTQYDRFKFLKETNIKRVFDNFPVTQQYLIDTFWKVNETPEFSKHPIKVMFVDIEVYAPDDFPHASEAKEPVNVITIYDSLINKFITWGIKDYSTDDPDVKYVKCVNEKDIFIKFIEYFEKDYPDILTGWNSEFFDIPYIINRCTKILGQEYTKRLSPTGNVYDRKIKGQFGQEQTRWYIEGISLIDYLDVYKRFCLGLRESYKLNSIAQVELGESKVDIGATNLATLADKDWKTFIDYNIQDVKLLVKLEEKLKYTELIRMLAYVGLTTFEAAMGSLSVINGATAVKARYRNQKIPSFIRNEDDGTKNPGAYVGEPLNGFQQNIISFDANSLYPNVMISLNISPETKVGVIEDKNDNEVTIRHVSGKTYTLPLDKFASFVSKEQIAISKANVLFTQNKKGVMPEILDYYYEKRQTIKKTLSKLKRQYANFQDKTSAEAKSVKLNIDQLDAKQMCIKVFINSIYGYFGNKNAPFGDDDIASSITLTGQSVIKHSNELLKTFIRNEINDIEQDELDKCIIYNDTDSSYVSIKPLINKGLPFAVKGKLCKETLDKVNEIEAFLNKEIKVWGGKVLNSKDCRFVFKREAIADVGVFLQKKRYVIHILDDEGIACDKFKYTGVEVVRSTMPNAIKPYVKKIIETMLSTQNINETNKLLNETYDIFKDLPVEDITFVSGIKGYEKYAGQCDGFVTAKGMPCHVKAAYMYNLLLDRFNITTKYEKISSGDKVRYFYVRQPNKFNISAIAYKYYYPEEFKEIFEPDYETMFENHIFSVIERFYQNVNWTAQKPGSLVQTNLFDLLS
jgi:DNA polymerase elongation subunit (family B)